MAPQVLEPNTRSLELSISDVAVMIGVSVATVRRWADAGHLASYRTPGGQRRFSTADVDSFLTRLASRQQAGAAR
jgi:excisionase family DNA binding protein